MLLPSALPCSTHPKPSYQSANLPALLPAPILSQTTFPKDNSSIITSGIITTCRTLHNLLNIPTAHNYHTIVNTTLAKTNDSAKAPKLPSSARAYHEDVRRGLESILLKKGLARSPRGEKAGDQSRTLLRETKGNITLVLNGGRKRGRDQDNEEGSTAMGGFSTPKRRRYGPVDLPLGLERKDFRALQTAETTNLMENERVGEIEDNEQQTYRGEEWDAEEDCMLVDLVLKKLKLSRKDWDECAKVLGREGASLGRRWKYLVGEGEVGIKFRKGGRKNRKSLKDLWSSGELGLGS